MTSRDEFAATPQPDDDVEPAYEDDPVAQFFSAHRAAVHVEGADDLDWARIARASRTRGPRNFLKGAVVAAAVAVIAGFGVWTVQSPLGQSPVEAAASRSSVAATRGSQSQPGSTSGPQVPTAVPAQFVTWSLTNAGHRTVYNLGAGTCGNSTCPVLLRTQDNGMSWSSVHIFGRSAAAAHVQPGSGRINAPGQLRDVRFMTATVGYVFGGDLWVTRDAGASFSRVQHPGRTVLDVVADRGNVLIVTGEQCTTSSCSGSVSVTKMDLSDNTVPTQGVTTSYLSTPINSARLVVKDGSGYLTMTGAADGVPLTPLPVKDGALGEGKGLNITACGGQPLQSLTPSLATSHHLLGLCAPVENGSRTSYTLVKSTDDGSNWSRVSTGAVQMPTGARTYLAAIDDTRMAVGAAGAGGAALASGGALVVSTDGGASFAAKDAPLTLPASGVDWLASPGGSQYYAVSLTSSGYWWSKDYGDTWTLVDPTR